MVVFLTILVLYLKFSLTMKYFMITAANNITALSEGRNDWMNLMIGVRGASVPAWATFNYVVNRTPDGSGKTSVEKFTEADKYELTAAGEASYSLNGNVLQFAIPRSVLGIGSGDFTITFKVTDSIREAGNILDYYVSGEAFPVGRFAYEYTTGGSKDNSSDPGKQNSGTAEPGSETLKDGGVNVPLIVGLSAGGAAVAAGAVTAAAVAVKKKKNKKIQ